MNQRSRKIVGWISLILIIGSLVFGTINTEPTGDMNITPGVVLIFIYIVLSIIAKIWMIRGKCMISISLLPIAALMLFVVIGGAVDPIPPETEAVRLSATMAFHVFIILCFSPLVDLFDSYNTIFRKFDSC